MAGLKRALRTVQFYLPKLEHLRYDLHAAALRAVRRPWRADVGGLARLAFDGPQILDIGAYRGFAISAFRMIKPGARIVAFEANPGLAERLAQQYAGVADIRVEACGLGERRERRTLYVPVYRGHPFDGVASLDRVAARNWINGDRVLFFDPGRLRVAELGTELRPLDGFGLTPDLVKLYVQGAEGAVLRGGADTFHRHQPIVLAPSYFGEADAVLTGWGFQRFAWAGGRFVPGGHGSYYSWYVPPARLGLLPR